MNSKMEKEINTDPVYAIGMAAKKIGVSVHLLRVYEREGLILAERTESGRRLYSDLEIEKAHCIRKMINEHGLNFAGIRRLLALLPCWRMRNCDDHEKESCSAFKITDRPCWATEEKCANPLPSCRDCPVYRMSVDCEQMKKIILDT